MFPLLFTGLAVHYRGDYTELAVNLSVYQQYPLTHSVLLVLLVSDVSAP